jgi:IrrE N-terminal-like domain
MSGLLVPKIYVRPDSELEIAEHASRLLTRGDCLGVLPTPIDRLYDLAKVREVELDRSEASSILSRFSEHAKSLVMGILNQVRGAADLRKRIVFMPQDDTRPRIHFARTHELGHQVLPWHRVNEDFLDNDQTLSPRIKSRFELEANLFAAEVIFQGVRFQEMARQYRPDFASVMQLASRHGSSKHATLWRFVEAHDEALAGITYYPINKDPSPEGMQAGFVIDKVVRSAAFVKRYGSMTFDGYLDFRHEWAQARTTGRQPVLGEIPFSLEGRIEPFLWESFWNNYCLMVLVRRRPILRSVARLLRRSSS